MFADLLLSAQEPFQALIGSLILEIELERSDVCLTLIWWLIPGICSTNVEEGCEGDMQKGNVDAPGAENDLHQKYNFLYLSNKTNECNHNKVLTMKTNILETHPMFCTHVFLSIVSMKRKWLLKILAPVSIFTFFQGINSSSTVFIGVGCICLYFHIPMFCFFACGVPSFCPLWCSSPFDLWLFFSY